MEDLGERVIYLDGPIRIIVNEVIIDLDQLKWRENEGIGRLTLNEISGQINADMGSLIYVWTELGLSGKIYQCGNYEEAGWCLHGTTKGFA